MEDCCRNARAVVALHADRPCFGEATVLPPFAAGRFVVGDRAAADAP
jgi:hypothetical protein